MADEFSGPTISIAINYANRFAGPVISASLGGVDEFAGPVVHYFSAAAWQAPTLFALRRVRVGKFLTFPARGPRRRK